MIRFALSIMAFGLGAFAMSVYTKPNAVPYRDVFYAVHVTDTAGAKPVHYLERGKLTSGELLELPTLYRVRYYDSGRVEDIGIEYQQWWKQ